MIQTRFNTIQKNNQTYEPPHAKQKKWHVRLAKTQISLSIRPVWSESLLSAWRNVGPLTTYLAHSEDSDQTGHTRAVTHIVVG